MNELALFAGAGGGLLATHHLLGWRCVGYVEKEEYPCKVLEARINDGLLSKAPIYQMHTSEFIRLGLAEKYRGVVEIITAGFPCTPFSRAGKQLGELDERNGWPDTIAIIRIVRPRFVLLENSSTLIANEYFGTILGDLAASGYDTRWDCIPASAIGANHERDRVWIVAHANRNGRHKNVERQPFQSNRNGQQAGEEVAHAEGIGWDGPGAKATGGDTEVRGAQEPTGGCGSSGGGNGNLCKSPEQRLSDGRSSSLGDASLQKSKRSGSPIPHPNSERPQRQGLQRPTPYRSWWETEPALGRVADGVAARVDRIKAIGNGQVPAVVAAVWRMLMPEEGNYEI